MIGSGVIFSTDSADSIFKTLLVNMSGAFAYTARWMRDVVRASAYIAPGRYGDFFST